MTPSGEYTRSKRARCSSAGSASGSAWIQRIFGHWARASSSNCSEGSTAVTIAPCAARSAEASPVPHWRCSTFFPGSSPSVALTIGGRPGRASRRSRCIASNACRLCSVGSMSGREREAAVDDDCLPADHGRVRRTKKGDGCCDVLGLDEATRWCSFHRTKHLLLVREMVERAGIDHPSRNGVHAYPRRELDCEVAHDGL